MPDSATLLSQRVANLETALAEVKKSTWDLVVETPSGAKNGSNKDFRLSRPPTLLLLFSDGVYLKEGADYEVKGVFLKLYSAPAPTARLVAVMLCKSTLAEGVAGQTGWYVGQTPDTPTGPATRLRAGGQGWYEPVRLATTAALPAHTYNATTKRMTASANGGLMVDGVAVAVGDRILVKDETGASVARKGIWTVVQAGDGANPWILERAGDFDESEDMVAGGMVCIQEGSTNADTHWILTSDEPLTLDVSAPVWQRPTLPASSITSGVLPMARGGTGHSTNSKGDLLVGDGTQWLRQVVGLDGRALTADSSQTSGVKWDVLGLAGGGTGHSTNSKGDLLVGDGTQWLRLPAGSNGQILVADSAQASGIGWIPPLFGVCDGRLTVQGGVAVPTSDQNGTTVYFTPFRGTRLGLYNGSSWVVVNFSELSIPLSQSQIGTRTSGSAVITGLADTSQLAVGMKVTGPGIPASTVINSIDSASQVTLNNAATSSGTDSYTFAVAPDKNVDIFAWLSGGTAKLEMTLWTNDTTRATGLTFQDGIYVRSGAPTRRYLGTVRTSSTDGRVDDAVVKRFVWNYYNRVVRRLFSCPGYNNNNAATSYTTSSTTFVQANGGTGSKLEFVVGVQEDDVLAHINQYVQNDTANQTGIAGLGVDSTTGAVATTYARSFSANLGFASALTYVYSPAPGYRHLNLLIRVGGGLGTWFADDSRGGSAADPYLTWIAALVRA